MSELRMKIESINRRDLMRVCRTCLGKSRIMKNVFEIHISGYRFHEMISLCTGDEPHKDDGLPPRICQKCSESLHVFFLFAKSCREACTLLKSYILNDRLEELEAMKSITDSKSSTLAEIADDVVNNTADISSNEVTNITTPARNNIKERMYKTLFATKNISQPDDTCLSSADDKKRKSAYHLSSTITASNVDEICAVGSKIKKYIFKTFPMTKNLPRPPKIEFASVTVKSETSFDEIEDAEIMYPIEVEELQICKKETSNDEENRLSDLKTESHCMENDDANTNKKMSESNSEEESWSLSKYIDLQNTKKGIVPERKAMEYLIMTSPSEDHNYLGTIGQPIRDLKGDLPSTSSRKRKSELPSRLSGRHFMEKLPPTEKKLVNMARCVVCLSKRVRKESRYRCKQCKQALCVEYCFEEYHTIETY